MAATNTPESYGSIARFFHWVTVAFILMLIPLGIMANDSPMTTQDELSQKVWLFSLHKTLGVTLLFLALARIAWAVTQPRPRLLNGARPAEALLAETVHWLLYGSLLLVPLTGWLEHSAQDGFAPIWGPLERLPFIPQNAALAEVFAALHIIFERVLVISALLHIVGALKHHFIDRDMTLRRMLPGGGAAAGVETPFSTAVPLALALLLWGAAVGAGAKLGVFSHDAPEQDRPAAALEATPSEWQVIDGTLEITVLQMGSAITGQFADWTAAIDFTDPQAPGATGTVTATIAIPSLTLGGVTEEALKPGYFDAAVHPAAVFRGDLEHIEERYTARGTLTLKGVEVPLEFPFTLTLNEDTADAEAQFTLDRRSFGIGDSVTDEASLAFSVEVQLRFSARRTGT